MRRAGCLLIKVRASSLSLKTNTPQFKDQRQERQTGRRRIKNQPQNPRRLFCCFAFQISNSNFPFPFPISIPQRGIGNRKTSTTTSLVPRAHAYVRICKYKIQNPKNNNREHDRPSAARSAGKVPLLLLQCMRAHFDCISYLQSHCRLHNGNGSLVCVLLYICMLICWYTRHTGHLAMALV